MMHKKKDSLLLFMKFLGIFYLAFLLQLLLFAE
nr:MAG TPA: hypothetical protein [Caudoviricetes sp.]